MARLAVTAVITPAQLPSHGNRISKWVSARCMLLSPLNQRELQRGLDEGDEKGGGQRLCGQKVPTTPPHLSPPTRIRSFRARPSLADQIT